MTVHDLAVERVAVARLRTYHRNPRQGWLPALLDSLRVNGQYKPIVVNRGTHTGRRYEVLAGNHTLIAARDLAWDDIAVCWVDVDDDQAARIVVADNRVGDLGNYDNRLLAELLGDLPDLTGTGYDESTLEELVAALGDEDGDGSGEQPGKGEALALAAATLGEPRIAAAHGEVWMLDKHTLVVADVHTEHALWAAELRPEHLFWPYPTLLAPFAEQAQNQPVLMVQPHLYLAGWLLTKWADLTGQEPRPGEAA
ncbi:ParB/RepB/Spo0J family partition protein [Pseudonocardia acaciae]|uniref:ParB/RepB/Spo0J family partition protein n=1 Tax=Pseudonocardia acaciae TaxID=551276 RepID=UPI000A769699|nr:ParB N-terminal domain-containing protein [Pseudonocardia acaciae]